MSLIAWYPLNGDTLDYSGNGNHGTGTITYNSSGKTGQTIDTNTGVVTITLNNMIKSVFSGNKMSLCLWWKQYAIPTNWADIIQYTDVVGIQRRLEVGYASANPNYHTLWTNIGKDDTTYNGAVYNSDNFASIGDWIHLAFVRDNNFYYVYKNGIKYATITVTNDIPIINTNLTLATHDNAYSYMNDVRFYNHALSEKEVYELSKAKIVHYKFNDFQEPTENLFPNITGQISKYNISQYVGKQDNISGNFTYSTTIHGTYTLSADIKLYPDDGATNPRLTLIFKYTDATTESSSTYYNKDGISRRISVTKVSNTTKILQSVYGYVLDYSTPNVRHADAFNIQLEQKDHATPFIDGSRTGLVTDCSGYEHHIILDSADTPTWVSESKLGSGCYKFNGVNNRMRINSLTISALQDITYSAWVYIDDTFSTTGAIVAGQISTSSAFYIDLNKKLHGAQDDSGISSSSTIPINQWSHVVYSFSFDGISTAYQKLYINGVLVQSRTDNAYTDTYTDDMWIGYDDRFYSYFNGMIDDVRIYATALSDQDIKNLCEVRTSLDKNGNIFVDQLSYEFPKSAYDIQQKYPGAKTGIYLIQPDSNQEPFLAYCDMDTAGGGWTLLVCTNFHDWNDSTIYLRNKENPSILSNYSILLYGDLIKTNLDGKLNYRLDAVSFGHWGGVWEAPINNTFVGESVVTNANIIQQFDIWTPNTSLSSTSAPSALVMPWIKKGTNTLLSTWGNVGSWWGTILSNDTGYNPAPWISSQQPNPGIIWYWVK